MLLTTTQLATKLNVSAQTLRRWEKEGKITSKKTLGGHRRYENPDINSFLLDNSKSELKEIDKIKNDFEYFCEKYVTIQDRNENKSIPFKLNESQKDFLKLIESDDKIIRHSGIRNSGMTTLMEAYMAHKLITTNNIKMSFVSFNRNHSNNVLKNVTNIIAHCPKFLNITPLKDNISHKRFTNKSEIITLTVSKDGCIGYRNDLVFLDNCSHLNNFGDFFNSILGTISVSDGKIIIES